MQSFSEDLVTGHRYLFETTDGHQSYRVNCTSGKLVWWIDRPAINASDVKDAEWDPTTQLPAAQLRAIIAESFLRAYDPGFEMLKMQPLNPEGANSCYVQRLPNSV